MGAFTTITLEKADRLGTLTINRPDALNALNSTVLTELEHAVDSVRNDPAIGVLVITGSGSKAFIAGADIKEMAQKTPMEAREFTALGQRVNRKLEELPQPVIAAINGFALGGGCELALACDIRIAAENAKIGLPEVGLGLHPGFGGTQRLLRLVGRGKAAELIFTADHITAQEAERIGLVNKVVPAEKLHEEVRALAMRILTRAPVALQLAKACLTRGDDAPMTTALAYENETAALCFSTDDIREGFNAFIEKRKPAFKGR